MPATQAMGRPSDASARARPRVRSRPPRHSQRACDQQAGNQPAIPYYTIRISLPAEEVARLKDIRLVPGMPAEVFIQTHERTPLGYLLKPLEEQLARTFRER